MSPNGAKRLECAQLAAAAGCRGTILYPKTVERSGPLRERQQAARTPDASRRWVTPGFSTSIFGVSPILNAVSEYQQLQQELGYTFQNLALLRLALTHPSVAHEQGLPLQTNQRLEFLGDAVLQLVLTRELYQNFPAVGEGPLTKARAKLVNRRTLAERARQVGLGGNLILSRGGG